MAAAVFFRGAFAVISPSAERIPFVADGCITHWLLLGLMGLFLIVEVLLIFVQKRYDILAGIVWGVYLTAYISLGFFIGDPLCVLLYVLAGLIAVFSLVYLIYRIKALHDYRPEKEIKPKRVKEPGGLSRGSGTDGELPPEVKAAVKKEQLRVLAESAPAEEENPLEKENRLLERIRRREEKEKLKRQKSDWLKYNPELDEPEDEPIVYEEIHGGEEGVPLRELEETNQVVAVKRVKGKLKSGAAPTAEFDPEKLAEMRRAARAAAKNQKRPVIRVIDYRIKHEKDLYRKNMWMILFNELTEEEMEEGYEYDFSAAAPADGEIIITPGGLSEEDILNAEIERMEYIRAKKAGGLAVIPPLRFKLSREDVIDHIETAAKNKEEFPVKPVVHKRRKETRPDNLNCGDYCFGLMYERSEVLKLVLCLDEQTYQSVEEQFTGIKAAKYPEGEDWYNIFANSSFGAKKDVFDIIDKSYGHVFTKYYGAKTDNRTAKPFNFFAGLRQTAGVRRDARRFEGAPDLDFDEAVEEYKIAYEKHKEENKPGFVLTRERMCKYIRRIQPGQCEVVERSKQYLPASLKSNNRTYALIHEKPDGVHLTVRISETYAQKLMAEHPGVCRARFPKGANWYYVPVGGDFKNIHAVYDLLSAAKDFVDGKIN